MTGQTSQKLSAYLQTKASLWYWATVALTLLSIIVIFSLQGFNRFVAGSIFILGLPGYSLMRALFPPKFSSLKTMGGVDNLTAFSLTIVLSIAVVSVVGVMLSFTPMGAQLNTVVLSLSLLSIFFATVAVVRDNKIR